MSNHIKVGDVCEVVATCCEYSAQCKGLECTVTGGRAFSHFRCDCGFTTSQYVFVEYSNPPPLCDHLGLGRRPSVPLCFLRKKPPKQTDDAEPRLEHVPADPEFIEDLQRRLSKTKETA